MLGIGSEGLALFVLLFGEAGRNASGSQAFGIPHYYLVYSVRKEDRVILIILG